MFRSTGTDGKFSQLELLNNTISGRVTADPLLSKLTRVSYGTWYRGDSTAGEKRLTSTVFGYATATSDVPKTGSATYSTSVSGRVVSVLGGATTISRITGTATLSVNYSTGLVSVSMTLSSVAAGGATTPLGTFNGTAGVATESNVFTGSIAGASTYPGVFTGGFFGSAGEEIGISFAASGTAGGADQRIVGTIVADRN